LTLRLTAIKKWCQAAFSLTARKVMAKLLMVESDSGGLSLYAAALRKEGHDVILTPSPREAFACFKFDRPDLLVLNIHLPAMDAMDAVGNMLSLDGNVPVVFAGGDPGPRACDACSGQAPDLADLKRTIRDVLSSR
jgi:DNA-binding NtrC family response regulator